MKLKLNGAVIKAGKMMIQSTGKMMETIGRTGLMKIGMHGGMTLTGTTGIGMMKMMTFGKKRIGMKETMR